MQQRHQLPDRRDTQDVDTFHQLGLTGMAEWPHPLRRGETLTHNIGGDELTAALDGNGSAEQLVDFGPLPHVEPAA
jgi:hypothetical protein